MTNKQTAAEIADSTANKAYGELWEQRFKDGYCVLVDEDTPKESMLSTIFDILKLIVKFAFFLAAMLTIAVFIHQVGKELNIAEVVFFGIAYFIWKDLKGKK